MEEKRVPLKKSISKKRKRLVKIITILFWIALSSIVVSFVYLIVFSQALRITSVHAVGDLYQAEVDQTMQNTLAEKWLWIIPRDRLFTISKSHITSVILQNTPEIKSVYIERSGLHALIATYKLRTPAFLLTNGKALDAQDISYTDRRDTSMVPLLVASSTTFDNDTYTKLTDIVSKVSIRLFPVARVTFGEAGDVTLFDKDNKEMRFNLNNNEEDIWSKLLSALDTEPLKSNVDNNNNFLYIDARFGDKVFYKLSSTQTASTTPASSTSTLKSIR